MEIPDGWISESDLRAGIGVTDEDRDAFHRNLVNWRYHWLLPQRCDGFPVPAIRPLGFAVGNEAFYPAITVEMVRRINEQRQHSKNMEKWLWQLWLDGYPVDIIEWCRTRLSKIRPVVEKDAKELVDFATRKPAKRSDPRRSFYRRLMARGWLGLMTWTVHIAIGKRPPESIFDPHSPPRSALARIFGIGTEPLAIRAGLDDSGIEELSIARLLAVLDEDIAAGELHKVREDCWVLSRLPKAQTLIGKIFAAVGRSPSCRAGLLPALILLHRSPDHQDTLLDVAKRCSTSPTAHEFEIPHAR